LPWGGATLLGAGSSTTQPASAGTCRPALGEIERESWAQDQGQRNTEMVRFYGERVSGAVTPRV